MRKIAIYCRVSTDEQAKNREGSITSQIHRLQMKVDEKNRYENGKWGKVVNIYKDEAFSGKNMDRPEFQRMLSDVKSKRVNTILVTELSRLSRSVTDFLNFIKELEDYGCDFICLQYDFDTTSPAGKVFMTIIMALAQFERELTAERIKNNFHARALRGLSNGGTLFLGYDKDPTQSGKLVVNKEEATIVKSIFDKYLEVDGIAEVVNDLNEKGFSNKSWISKSGSKCGGKKFTIATIWRILTNYAYIGKREINKTNKELEQESLKQEERYHLVDASWEPIVDAETFNRVNDKLSKNKKVKYPTTFNFSYSGIAICDECGGPLCGQSGTGRNGKHYYYGHTKKTNCRVQRYNAEEFEKLIRKQLFALVNVEAMNKQFIEVVGSQIKNSPKTSKALIDVKRREIEKVSLETEKLVNLVANNPLAQSANSLLARITSNEELIAKLESEKVRLEEKALLEVESQKVDPEFVLSGIKKLREDGFRKAKISKKRAIVQEVIKTIHVSPDNVIRIDFWANESQSEAYREASRQAGVVLPFRKLGMPLEASFRQNASRDDEYTEIKKAAGLGTYVLSNSGFLMDGGSSSFLNGRGDRIRTCGPLVPNQMRYRTAPLPDQKEFRL
jgi:site-specific DNA recombinase